MEAFQVNEGFNKAKTDLGNLGKIITKSVEKGNNVFFRVKIEIDGKTYIAENVDSKIATIQLWQEVFE